MSDTNERATVGNCGADTDTNVGAFADDDSTPIRNTRTILGELIDFAWERAEVDPAQRRKHQTIAHKLTVALAELILREAGHA